MPALALSLLFLFLLLSGCAPKARFPAGQAILRGETPAGPPLPDSLRAGLELTGFQGGRKTSVSAALSAVPWKRYKLDLYGLPGMVAASFLWTDTGWTLVLYERDGYLQGYGDAVDLPGLGIGSAPVHDLFACLWGDFFPGDGPAGRDGGAAGPDSAGMGAPGGAKGFGETGGSVLPGSWEKGEGGTVAYEAGGFRWTATLDSRTGTVQEAVRADSAFRIVYLDYRLRNGRPVPGKVRVFAGSRPLLEIGVGPVEDNPAWKRNPFRIRIPEGFSPLVLPSGG